MGKQWTLDSCQQYVCLTGPLFTTVCANFTYNNNEKHICPMIYEAQILYNL